MCLLRLVTDWRKLKLFRCHALQEATAARESVLVQLFLRTQVHQKVNEKEADHWDHISEKGNVSELRVWPGTQVHSNARGSEDTRSQSRSRITMREVEKHSCLG